MVKAAVASPSTCTMFAPLRIVGLRRAGIEHGFDSRA